MGKQFDREILIRLLQHGKEQGGKKHEELITKALQNLRTLDKKGLKSNQRLNLEAIQERYERRPENLIQALLKASKPIYTDAVKQHREMKLAEILADETKLEKLAEKANKGNKQAIKDITRIDEAITNVERFAKYGMPFDESGAKRGKTPKKSYKSKKPKK